MYKLPESLPLEERWKKVCADNMILRGGLRDIIDYCDKLTKLGEANINNIHIIHNIARSVLK